VSHTDEITLTSHLVTPPHRAPEPMRATFEPRHVTYGPGAGLTLGLIGLGCVAISLLAVSWLDAPGTSFLELGSRARRAGSAGLGVPAFGYLTWAGFVLLALTAALVLLAGIPVPRTATGNSYARIMGAAVAGAAAVAHTYAIVHAFPVALVAPGAWLGVAGYLTAVVGFVVGARRRVR
jgi:hypothetical protein